MIVRLRCLLLVIGLLTLISPASAQPESPADPAPGYRLPPAALQAIVDAPRPPQLFPSPKRDLAAMVRIPALPGIVNVAQPERKLAGVRINPRTYSQSRFTFGTELWLIDVATAQEIKLTGLPENLRLADLQWSPNQRHIAFSNVRQDVGEVELWLVDIARRTARKGSKAPLNTVRGRGFTWMP